MEDRHESRGRDYLHPLKRFDVQHAPIAGHNKICPSLDRGLEESIVVGIDSDDGQCDRGLDNQRAFGEFRNR